MSKCKAELKIVLVRGNNPDRFAFVYPKARKELPNSMNIFNSKWSSFQGVDRAAFKTIDLLINVKQSRQESSL